MSARPRLLDLFCGAGGAAMGYHRAGFDVVGVDINRQPHYPFEFHQGDAMSWPLEGFDVIHASPPCQAFSKAVKVRNRVNRPDLLTPIREKLRNAGVVYVIENVPSAPMVDYITLCGSAFGLPIRRHRRFESSLFLLSNGCAHEAYPAIYAPASNRINPLRVMSISGGFYQRQGSLEDHKRAMGIDWHVTVNELSEAIPPAYTEYIGAQLMAQLTVAA